MSERYVILTGTKSNAGDFFIRHRALELFAAVRPDREVVPLDGWRGLDESSLALVNGSRALILTGSPSLQGEMYPGIYPLVDDLSRIKVPIVTMAIGWKGKSGSWEECCRYRLGAGTLLLLRRIAESGIVSSVRDYHTLNVLRAQGFDNFLVTGCAGLFSLEHLGKESPLPRAPRRVSFSQGVSFFRSRKGAEQNRRLILSLRDAFPQAEFTVVFHHAARPDTYRQTHKPNLPLAEAHARLIPWLDREGVKWKDISGGAEAMLEHYRECDLHVGYRVHAHILMAGISRPTVLIAEDGRGAALRDLLGGMIFDLTAPAVFGRGGRLAELVGGAGRRNLASPNLPNFLLNQLRYEMEHDFPRMRTQRAHIDRHFAVMKEFLLGLP